MKFNPCLLTSLLLVPRSGLPAPDASKQFAGADRQATIGLSHDSSQSHEPARQPQDAGDDLIVQPRTNP